MGKVLIFKVKERGRRDSVDYKNRINIQDSNQISTVLEDLNNLFNAPIEKACRKFLKGKDKFFPLS